ncbi:MAG: YebC/PmpR family DNA-binding transcriptional regulator [Planctomycetota bacterium]
MSGHSHWATIRHKKQATDAKKGKIFSKISKLIIVAAREGGGDLSGNYKLQYAVSKAREMNMPKENVDKAIKKGTGELEGSQIESVIYEGFGPGGAAIMVETLTDNRNRTIPEIRRIFEMRGGNLGATNSVNWMFERKGFFTIAGNLPEDELLSAALEAGAADAELAGDVFEITCSPKDFEKVKTALIAKKLTPKTAEITFVPKNYVAVNQKDGQRLMELTEALEDHDDVQNVYANFDIPEPATGQTEK